MSRFDRFGDVEITPQEFEIEVAKYLRVNAVTIKDTIVKHNVKLPGSDGVYQIDVTAEFEALGAKYLTLVECKYQKNPVKREVIQALNDKIRSTGAQKGILFATSGFQSGALEYAKAHGIALVRVVNGECIYETRSGDPRHQVVPVWLNVPKYAFYLTSLTDSNSVLLQLLDDNDAYLLRSLCEA